MLKIIENCSNNKAVKVYSLRRFEVSLCFRSIIVCFCTGRRWNASIDHKNSDDRVVM